MFHFFEVRMADEDGPAYAHIGDAYKGMHKHDSLDKALGALDEWQHVDNQTHLYNDIFKPAHDGLYDGISGALGESLGDDTTKTFKKKSELEKAVTAGLKDFFAKANPAVLVDGFDEWDEKDQHEHLVHHYDDMIGVGKIKGAEKYSMRGLIKGASSNRDFTVGQMKQILSQGQAGRIESAMKVLNSQYLTANLGTYQPMEIAKYLAPHIESAGFEIEDKVGFHKMGLEDLLDTRAQLVTGKDIEKGGILKKKKAEE